MKREPRKLGKNGEGEKLKENLKGTFLIEQKYKQVQKYIEKNWKDQETRLKDDDNKNKRKTGRLSMFLFGEGMFWVNIARRQRIEKNSTGPVRSEIREWVHSQVLLPITYIYIYRRGPEPGHSIVLGTMQGRRNIK